MIRRFRLKPGTAAARPWTMGLTIPRSGTGAGTGDGSGTVGDVAIVMSHCIQLLPDADHATYVFAILNLPPDAEIAWTTDAEVVVGGLDRPCLYLVTTGSVAGYSVSATVNGVDAGTFDMSEISTGVDCIFYDGGE